MKSKGQFQISDFFIFGLFFILMIILFGIISTQKQGLEEVITNDFTYVNGELLLTTFMRTPVNDADFKSVKNMADLVSLGKSDDSARNKLHAELLRFLDNFGENYNSEYQWITIRVIFEDKFIDDILEVSQKGTGDRLDEWIETSIYLPSSTGESIEVKVILS